MTKDLRLLPAIRAAVCVLALSLPPGKAWTQDDPSAVYASCLLLASRAPEEALGKARAWAENGGGPPARHCAAVALIGLERYREAADALRSLAEEISQTQPELAAEALAQAGTAWLLAGDLLAADAAYGDALVLQPYDVEILIDRSLARATDGRYAEALEDLEKARALAPKRAEILTFTASAHRSLGHIEQAVEAIEAALVLAPDDPEARLERGILRRLQGDEAGARQDWLAVIDTAPETPAAEIAKRNLERLETDKQ